MNRRVRLLDWLIDRLIDIRIWLARDSHWADGLPDCDMVDFSDNKRRGGKTFFVDVSHPLASDDNPGDDPNLPLLTWEMAFQRSREHDLAMENKNE